MANNYYRSPWWQHLMPSTRRGIYAVGQSPSFTFSSSSVAVVAVAPNATGYVVRDYYGDVVSSGSITGNPLVPAAPAGGWLPGWYRIYCTGPNSDPTTGNCYTEATFVVFRADARFPANTLAVNASGGTDTESIDLVSKAICGMGTTRMSVSASDMASPSAISSRIAVLLANAALSQSWWSAPAAPAQVDPARPNRRQWVAFPNGGFDVLNASNLACYVADPAIDGAEVFVQTEAGSVSGMKVTVRFPDAGTVVETYDNLANVGAAVAAINGTSAYLWCASWGGGAWTAPVAATAIGSSKWDALQAVVNGVYPTIRCFEGPQNEGHVDDELVHRSWLFHAAVKGAQPSATVLGPCVVTTDESYWQDFILKAGGYFDEIATHMYNLLDGNNLAQGRRIMTTWKGWLADAGCGAKPIWDTESNVAAADQGGVYHWRKPADALFYTLFLEQEGVSRERANFWYDRSHGFWGFPSFWQYENMLFTHAILYRTFAEETFGYPFQRRINFGTIADDLFLGNVYRTSDALAGVLVVCGAGELPGAEVTFSVAGMTDGTLVAVDALSRESTVTVTGGRLTLTVDRTEPTFVRLPAGVTVDYLTCLGWSDIQGLGNFGTQPVYGKGTISGAGAGINNGQTGTSFRRADQMWYATSEAPTTAVVQFENPYRADQIMLWFGVPNGWNPMTVALSGSVEGSSDGATWEPVGSFDSSATATSIQWVSSAYRETWWRPQWFYQFRLDSPMMYRAIRVNVDQTSYGYEPDAECAAVSIAPSPPKVTLREVMILCNANNRPQYVIAAGP